MYRELGFWRRGSTKFSTSLPALVTCVPPPNSPVLGSPVVAATSAAVDVVVVVIHVHVKEAEQIKDL
jgi:uncharacterized membrane protein